MESCNHNKVFHNLHYTFTILPLLFVLPTVLLADHGNLMNIQQVTPDLKLPEINISWSAQGIFIILLFLMVFLFS